MCSSDCLALGNASLGWCQDIQEVPKLQHLLPQLLIKLSALAALTSFVRLLMLLGAFFAIAATSTTTCSLRGTCRAAGKVAASS
jgi:hypothetical protein